MNEGQDREWVANIPGANLEPMRMLPWILRERGRVESYLDAYPFLASLMMAVRTKIQEYFGSVDIALEVCRDPDAPGAEQLFVLIRIPPDHQGPDGVEAALDRLRRFDDEWWLEASPEAQGRLSIHLEFV